MSDLSWASGGASGNSGFLVSLAILFLLVLFIALKLAGVVIWSWFLVLTPLWIILGVGLCIFVAVLFAALVSTLISSRSKGTEHE